jgi:hypothetical protein
MQDEIVEVKDLQPSLQISDGKFTAKRRVQICL